MTTVAGRRHAVQDVITAARVSERRACRFVGVARSTQRYVAQRDDTDLRARLETLAMLKPRWGYRRLHWLLTREGWSVNRKRVQRVYRAAGLHVRRRRRKRVMRPRVVRPGPQRPAERWSIDFVHDTLGTGRVFRALTIVDDFTRYCPAIVVDYGLSGERVIATLEQLATARPLPPTIVCDNGPEFTSQALDQWAYARGITLQFIRPGKPVENAYVESFNGRLRDECLNENWFATLDDARFTIERWRQEYNAGRPHSSLGDRTPEEFTRALAMASSTPNPENWSE
jgi:putative transposase